jgi:hypothetical protein
MTLDDHDVSIQAYHFNKCTALVQDVDSGEGYVVEEWVCLRLIHYFPLNFALSLKLLLNLSLFERMGGSKFGNKRSR